VVLTTVATIPDSTWKVLQTIEAECGVKRGFAQDAAARMKTALVQFDHFRMNARRRGADGKKEDGVRTGAAAAARTNSVSSATTPANARLRPTIAPTPAETPAVHTTGARVNTDQPEIVHSMLGNATATNATHGRQLHFRDSLDTRDNDDDDDDIGDAS
jgi:hypothetical protein